MNATHVTALLEPPRKVFGDLWVERWAKGPDADRRLRQLRRGLTVDTRSYTHRVRMSAEPGADRRDVRAVELTYTSPAGAPAIEAPASTADRSAA